MKENIEALIASIGCTVLLAVGLFYSGVLIGQTTPIGMLAPPRWLGFPFLFLLPWCSTLLLRAHRKQKQNTQWLETWSRAGRRRVVGYTTSRTRETIEEAWLRSHIDHSSGPAFARRLLDSASVWGWATLLNMLALAYICLWFGLMAARGG